MTIISQIFGKKDTPKTTFEDTVQTLGRMDDCKVVSISKEVIDSLSETFGEDSVQAGVKDNTSVIACPFTFNHKATLEVEYVTISSSSKLKSKEKKHKVSEIHQQMSEVFGEIKETKKDAKKGEFESFEHIHHDIKTLVKEGITEVKIIESEPNIPSLEELTKYFQRVKDVATIARELDEVEDLDENDYNTARQFAEEAWPFVGIYIQGHSSFETPEALKAEIEKRVTYLETIEKIEHKDKRLLQLLVHSYPDEIAKHPKLNSILVEHPTTLSKDASLGTIQRRRSQLTNSVDRAGLSLGDEIKMMHELFEASNEAMVELNSVGARKSELFNRNKMYIVGSADKKVVMKLVENAEHFSYELAASEMSELAGFQSICLPTKRGTLSGTTFNDEGDIVEEAIGVDLKKGLLEKPTSKKHQRKLSDPGMILMQKYAPSRSGIDIALNISKSVNEEKQRTPTGLLGQIPSLNRSYADMVKPFLEIDQQSYELNALNSFILGDHDANSGNTLFSEEGDHIYSIDHETMMPENNESINVRYPIVTKCEIDLTTQQIKPIVTEESELHEVCPLHNWLIGLPQGKIPFSKETIQHVLNHLSRDTFEAYHRAKQLFSKGQVAAQLERIDLILELFNEQAKKDPIDLTPRDLYMKIVGDHPTYTLLKDTYGLADYFVFQLLGKVPANVNGHAVRQLHDAINQHTQKTVMRQVPKAVVTKKIIVKSKGDHTTNQYFAPANVFSQIKQMQELQRWFNTSPDLYYLIWGKEMPKAEKKNTRGPMMGFPFLF